MIHQVSHGSAVTDAAERGGSLGPDLVLRVIEQADYRREGTLGPNLTQHICSPGSSGAVVSFIEHRDQGSHHCFPMARQDVRDPGSEPYLGILQRLDQLLDGTWIGNSREGPQGDLTDVGVF